MFTSALFTLGKTRTQLKCPETLGWVKNMGHKHKYQSREAPDGGDKRACTWRIHFDLQQKLRQHGKATLLQ